MKKLNSHSRKDQITIHVPIETFADAYFKHLQKKLKDSYVFNYEIKNKLMTFNGSLFRFVWNGWNVFNPISGGEIEFSEENEKPFIRHKIFFNEALVIALIFHLIPIFTLKYDPWLSLIVFVAIWMVYFVNYFIAVFRFNSFISEMLIQVNFEHGYAKLLEEAVG
jgi:hypothetical protein